ncbi:hypothetical protein ACB092_11G083100 [Castanea dentata]
MVDIPISVSLPEDSIIWAWTPNGRFTVKSTYKVAQKVLKEGLCWDEEGGNSENSRIKAIWKIVACKNILPTKLRLKAHGIGEDDRCDMCGLGESSGHTLWSYKIAEAVWSGIKLKLPCFQDPPRDFINIVWEIKESKLASRKPPAPDEPSWSPPKLGWYKVNTDEAIFEDIRCYRVGVVIRNERGELMGAMSKTIEEGVMLAWDLGLKDIIIESDAQLVINSLGKQFEGIMEGLRRFNAWEVTHTRMSGNNATHILARQAKFLNEFNIWVEDTPPKIVDQIQIDISQCDFNSS